MLTRPLSPASPLRALLSPIAGALAVLGFAPYQLPLFALLSPALLWLLLRGRSARSAFGLGWLYGLGFFGAGVSWVYISIHDFGAASVPLAGALTFAFCAALALLFAFQSWLGARWFHSGRWGWLGFVLLWWLFEWLRSWLLTGFPWLYLGYAWIDTPLRTWAPIAGVWGLSLLTLLLAAGSAEALSRRRLLPLLPGSALLLSTALLPNGWTEPAGAPLQVALVQPNTPQLAKWSQGHLEQIIERQIELTLPLADKDLIVWPETAIPAFYPQVAAQLMPLQAYLDEHNSALISGLPSRSADPGDPQRTLYYNSLALLSSGSGIYHKRRLVPFGEYVPLERQLRGLIDFFDLPMSAFSLPQQTQSPLQVKGQPLAAAICYEIAYPELVRESALDSTLILTVSNDTWFGRSIGPDQHLQIARMRAVENGRWVIRATNNGLTALIDADGQIKAQLPVDQTRVLEGEVQPMQGQTPYQRLGVWPLLTGVLLLLLALLLGNKLGVAVATACKQHRTAATRSDD